VCDFVSKLPREALDYWRRACREARIPAAEDYLDHVPPHLPPHLMIYDCLPDDILVRFHGSALIKRRGEDHTGQSWLKVNAHVAPRAVLDNVWAAVDHRCGLRTDAIFVTSIGRRLHVEALSLPLATRAGRPARVVNCSVGLDTMKFDERATGWTGAVAARWIDAGFGVPAFAPAPMR
jgi:hypothetical protein